MRIIPAIDIINGKCVRLEKGVYSTQKIYNENPLEVAKLFEANGIQYLHLVDLDGAKSNQIINIKILETIATKTELKIDFGGGIKSTESVNQAFNCGANQITAGSIAITNPSLVKDWLQEYGEDKIILGADVKDKKIVTHGWLNESNIHISDLISDFIPQKLQYIICTDVCKDGMLQGSSVKLYEEIKKEFASLKVVVSGGVSSLHELETYKQMQMDGIIIGKALYENKISLKDLRTYVD